MMRVSTIVCLMTVLAGPVAAQGWDIPTGPFDAARPLPERPEFSDAADVDFGDILEAAAKQNDRLARHRPDLEALSLDLMLDPEAAFAFFRDEIRTEAYPGHLRGPRAVLEAGAGNAHDKALALAAVLGGMGYDTRLMTAAATPEITAAIAANTCARTPGGSADVFRVAGLSEAVMTRIQARAHASYAALSDVAHPPEGPAPAPAASAEHHWVQARIANDWVDLDPAMPGTAMGQAPAGPGAEMQTPPKPHQIRVTLTLETLRDGALRTSDILTHSFDLPRDAERPVTLLFGPEVEGIGGILSETLSGLQGETAGMVATLLIGQDARKSRAFAAPGIAATAGGLFDAGQEEVSTALHLRLTGIVPGRPDAEAVREIFDIVPPDLRAGGAPIDPQALESPQAGARYPLALESLRHIVLGHGGLSAHVASVRMGAVLGDLPEAYRLFQAGAPDPQTVIWNGWVQASTVALASEELIRARPAAPGCLTMTRPRALIWGVGSAAPDQPVFWSDWVLDDVDVAGAPDAAAAWRLRAWHGALQGGLETEAVLTQYAVPTGAIAVDPGPMRALTPDQLTRLGPEAEADRAEGFALFTAPGLAAGEWWRVHPETGRADARFALYGNGRPFVERAGTLVTRHGSRAISALEEGMFWGTKENWNAWMRRVMHDAEQLAKKWEVEDRLKRSRGNEYLILLLTVSIPISLEAGSAIGGSVTQGLGYAMSI